MDEQDPDQVGETSTRQNSVPVLAQRILDWREEHGRFSAVEELQEVPGIGPATYADLKDRVRV